MLALKSRRVLLISPGLFMVCRCAFLRVFFVCLPRGLEERGDLKRCAGFKKQKLRARVRATNARRASLFAAKPEKTLHRDCHSGGIFSSARRFSSIGLYPPPILKLFVVQNDALALKSLCFEKIT
jgi:hypothetical protein